MDISKQTASEMYRRMFRSRSFELAAIEKLKIGEIPGALHTSVGQEASIVGSCLALRDDGFMVGNHRSHGHPISKGARMDRLFAELMGKVAGINSGKGGSMHIGLRVGSLGEPASSVQACRSRPARRSLEDAGKDRVTHASSATAPPTRAPSTKASTSPRYGNCQWCSSARTTATAS